MTDTTNEAPLAATDLPADAATLAADAAPSSTEPVQAVEATPTTDLPADSETGVSEDAALSPAIAEAPVQIPADDHEEAQGVLDSLLTKLENFEHALAADALAELNKLKELLHL